MSALTDAIVNFQAAAGVLAQKQAQVDNAQAALQVRITARDDQQKIVDDLRVVIETELDTINKRRS